MTNADKLSILALYASLLADEAQLDLKAGATPESQRRYVELDTAADKLRKEIAARK